MNPVRACVASKVLARNSDAETDAIALMDPPTCLDHPLVLMSLRARAICVLPLPMAHHLLPLPLHHLLPCLQEMIAVSTQVAIGDLDPITEIANANVAVIDVTGILPVKVGVVLAIASALDRALMTTMTVVGACEWAMIASALAEERNLPFSSHLMTYI